MVRCPSGDFATPHGQELDSASLHLTSVLSVVPFGVPVTDDDVAGHSAQLLLQPVVFLPRESRHQEFLERRPAVCFGKVGKSDHDIRSEGLHDLGDIPRVEQNLRPFKHSLSVVN
jgi:hypothetical protein